VIRRLCIIGVGLIGGSLARALRQAGAVDEVVGCSRRREHLQQAVDLGVIDRYSTDIAAAVKDADMILVAVPLGAMEAIFGAMAGQLAPDAVVTDAGSAKRSVIEAARRAFGELPAGFVPGHPIAGTEQSGVAASFADLYKGRRVILTPTDQTSVAALDKVSAMWQTAGAEVVCMEADLHDEVLAATSHLPHILAFGLVDSLARLNEHQEIFDNAAGGFRDFTRIASSDPVMWRDICLENRQALLAMMDRFAEDFARIRAAIEAGQGDELLEIFSRAKQARDEHAE